MAPYFLLSLIPRRQKNDKEARPLLTVLAGLSWIQWAHFFSGWLAWTCDAIDFFSVSLTVSRLAAQFGKQTSDITTAITLTLLLRVIGAVVFGILSDRYGRKWPLVFNLVLVAILQLGAGFVNTFNEFLAVRSLFGIGMGGIWGMAASTALENLPQGYAVGYLLAACINLKLVPVVPASLFAAAVRAVLPESEFFLNQKAREQGRTNSTEKTKTFIKETGRMVKTHWLLCIYALLFMTGFNFLSHGSQDLYPTYLQDSKGISEHNATVATIIGNCGAIAGGALAGFVSQYIGRRLTIVLFILLVGCFIPLWIIPSSFGALAAGAFCIQCPHPAFRATFPGVAYQLGNMVSSASAQIEATGGNHQRTTITKADGTTEDVPDYAKVQGILIGCVAVFLIVVTILGPENHGSHFEKHKTAFEEGGGDDDAVVDNHDGHRPCSINEKSSVRQKESVNV
ncbi:carboxylic acid transporter [Armillaria mellea]|nr:carboxylic acid transporter [Armillaria mellea]